MAGTKSGITNSPFIGISQFHIAKMITDPAEGTATYAEMIHIPQLREVQIKPQTNEESLYADDAAVESSNVVSKYQLTVDMANIPLEYRALLCGHDYDDKTGIMTIKSTDAAPYFLVAFQANKSNGKARFIKFVKVKFAEPDEDAKTKEENISYNTPQMTATAVYRNSDHVAVMQADEEAEGYIEQTKTDWFVTA